MNQLRDPYLRPNNHWECGSASGDCDPCPGPVGGRCPARPRCHPIKMGEKWVATLDPKLGKCVLGPLPNGQCCQGPGTCSPRPSLRAYRTAFVWCCVALTIAGLSFGFSKPRRAGFLAPGPLSSHHAQVLKGEGFDRCTACHEAASQTISQWLASTLGVGHHATTSQPQLCLRCHGEQFAESLALAAHNLDPDVLGQFTARVSGAAIPTSHSHREPIACSTCHREHHGSTFNLSQLTDRQCQTCHATQFQSFESNHLEFPASYPLRRRSRIAFDHAAHQAVHFASKNREFDCRSCHVADALQNVQLLQSYERTCQECHQQQVLENESLTLLTLPWIDTEAIRQSGSAVPQWPAPASGQFDGSIPPLMKVLLAADPQARAALDQLGFEFQFSDVDRSNHDQVRLAAEVANGINALVDELAEDAVAALRHRLAQSLGCAEDAKPLNDWLASVPIDALRSLKATWFAQNGATSKLTDQNSWVARPESSMGVVKSTSNATTPFAKPQGVPPNSSSTLGERHGMPTNPLSSAWLPGENDILARLGGVMDHPTSPQESDELVPNPLKGLVRPSSGQPVLKSPAFDNSQQSTAATDSQVGSNERVGDAAQTPAPKIPDDELLAINPLRDGNLPKIGGALATPSTPQPGASDSPNAPIVVAPQSAAFTSDGWRVDGATMTISYRPGKHLDGSLQALLNLIASIESKQENSAAQHLFEHLTSDVGVGACGKCHTVDRDSDGHSVNWKTQYRDPTIRGFTSFSHRPHLVSFEVPSPPPRVRGQGEGSLENSDSPLMAGTNHNCTSCHQLETGRTTAAQSRGDDPRVFASDFAPIRKATCAACHQSGLAKNGCTECHNYHIGSRANASLR